KSSSWPAVQPFSLCCCSDPSPSGPHQPPTSTARTGPTRSTPPARPCLPPGRHRPACRRGLAYPIGTPAQPARGLAPEQLAKAAIDDTTRLPEELRDRLPSTGPPTPTEQIQHGGPART